MDNYEITRHLWKEAVTFYGVLIQSLLVIEDFRNFSSITTTTTSITIFNAIKSYDAGIANVIYKW